MSFSRLVEQSVKLPRAVRRLGLVATMGLVQTHVSQYWSRQANGAKPLEKTLRSVQPRGCIAPIHYRINTTDIKVLQQVFLRGEYDCAGAEPDPEFIVDCGANIGCSSIFFLNRYPRARVLAIEADAGNFEVCRLNLEPYGSRAELILGGIWPKSEALVVDRGSDGMAGEWSFSVRPAREGESPEIDGVSLADLVREAPGGHIDLLKIDIEGGEETLFSVEADPWLSRTRTIVIELHGRACEEAFAQAIERYPFRVEKTSYVAIARRIDPT